MKKFVVGIIIGATLATAGSAFAADIKKYVLTAVGYPVVVNGVEYKDVQNPILNYEGSTYIPLAKIGDLTGVQYKWNDSLKRVEISDGGIASAEDVTTIVSDDGKLRDAKAIIAEREAIKKLEETPTMQVPDGASSTNNVPTVKGIVKENGETILNAFDKYGNFKGRFTNGADSNFDIANKSGLSISEGWLSFALLKTIYENGSMDYENNELILKGPLYSLDKEVYFRFPLSVDFLSQKEGEVISNGVNIKMCNGFMYLNIADLQKSGIVQ